MKVDVTPDEAYQINKALIMVGEDEDKRQELDWEVIANFLAKLDR